MPRRTTLRHQLDPQKKNSNVEQAERMCGRSVHQVIILFSMGFSTLFTTCPAGKEPGSLAYIGKEKKRARGVCTRIRPLDAVRFTHRVLLFWGLDWTEGPHEQGPLPHSCQELAEVVRSRQEPSEPEAGDQGFGSEGHLGPGYRLDSHTSLRIAAHRSRKGFALRLINCLRMYPQIRDTCRIGMPKASLSQRSLGLLEQVSQPLVHRGRRHHP